MKRHDSSVFDEYPSVIAAVVFLPAVGVPGIVLIALKDAPAWFACLAAAATCLPTGLAILLPIHWFDRVRTGDTRRSNTTGITGYGLLYAQAAVFFYAPMVVSGGEDEPIRHMGFVDAAICWIAAAATAWGGYRVKKRGERKFALANLARTHPQTATRFIARVDKKGWTEIEPGNVLQYQAAFEKGLAALGESPPNSISALSAEQEQALVRCAIGLRYSGQQIIWPFTTLALVLIYIDSPAVERERDHAEWAASVATHPEASRVRDWVQPIATQIFERQELERQARPSSPSSNPTSRAR